MPDADRIRFRHAEPTDAGPIAALHAESWRRHYRGAYSDTFLDGEVAAERLALWSEQLRARCPDQLTIVAEEAGSLVGFAHVVLDEDARWGALLANLHVAHTHQRQGIGSKLMALAARSAVEQRPASGLYLWVLEQNLPAQRFYEAQGGRRVGRDLVQAPGGGPGRLSGSPAKLRYAWSDPARLIVAR